MGSNATVNLQFTTNSGAAWSNIATGVAATNEHYFWAPGVEHPAVRWRVVVSTNSAVASTNAKAFSIRNGTNKTFTFYVNDSSQSYDMFCSAPGDDNNLGIFPNAPKRNLQAILSAYQLRAGDIVYVDTGTYDTSNTTTIGRFDSGRAGTPVRIVGSSMGTTLNRNSPGSDVLALEGTGNLEIENILLQGGRYGVHAGTSSNVLLRNVRAVNNQSGFYVAGAGVVFERCVAASNASVALEGLDIGRNQWRNGVIWGSPTLVQAASNSLSISNSILGNGAVLFGNQPVRGDYNLVWATGVGLTYSRFSDFQNAGLGMGWDRSLFADPLFADPNGFDFHLRSLAGRYVPAWGSFVTDAVHSPAIDFGHPSATAWTNEPMPNGERINVGVHGGTGQASKSKTNAWLQTLSFMDGGTLDSPVGAWLRWAGGNFGVGSTATLWLSRDNGVSWETIASGVDVAAGEYFYRNTDTNDPSSLFARWKVTLDGAVPAVSSQNATNFTYKNGVFEFYVNDNSRTGDVFCVAVGSDDNLGVSPEVPVANLHVLFAKYPLLGPGDRIYVDTGRYFATNIIIFKPNNSGVNGNPIVLAGSTNRMQGGTVLATGSLKFDFQSGASNVVIRDIVVSNVARAAAMNNASNIVLEGVEAIGAFQVAFDLQNTRNSELIRCVANGGGGGALLQGGTNLAIRNCVFWENSGYGVQIGAQVGAVLENSILASTKSGMSLLHQSAAAPNFRSDYNGLHAGPNTRVANRYGELADNLAAWQAISGQDIHSIPGNPLMANPNEYDYHLMTEQTMGRRLPDGQLTSDPVSSPLLDAGNPSTDASAEPGIKRINIGRWGGTWEASVATAIPWIRAVSYADAGSASNGTVSLLWTVGGVTNETGDIEVSVDGGKTWNVPVASGVPLTNGIASWTIAGVPNTPAATWRIVCRENTNLTARSTNFFAIRNAPLNLYVALSTIDLEEAEYVTAPGAPDNWMATSNAPISSLRTLLNRFDLAPGDRIWLDQGVYTEGQTISIGMKNSGNSANPLRIVGSRRNPYGGTVLRRPFGTILSIVRAGGVHLESLSFQDALVGISVNNCGAFSAEKILVSSINDGIALQSTPATLSRLLVTDCGSGIMASAGATVGLRHSMFRRNANALLVIGGTLDVRNNIFEAIGSGYVYYFEEPGTLNADYNNIRAIDGGNVAGGRGRRPDRFLIDWQRSSGFAQDMNSFGYDPQFASSEANDFHLRSEYGRFDPETGVFATNDLITSRLIDLGDPSVPATNEPAPNGGRVNVGLYGDGPEASKSAGTGALVPLTMSDGGTIRGEAKLYWSWNGMPPNEILQVDFSGDGGLTWTNIASNVYADVGTSGLLWSTTNFTSTGMGVWRVMTTNGALVGQTEILFALKNEPLSYYVNDASTEGDVYCTAPGSHTNTGLTPDSPIDSLNRLMARYKIEHGDTVYVDTGIYNQFWTISIPSLGATNRLVVQGSTNFAAGGSVITYGGFSLLKLSGSGNVDLRNFKLLGGNKGLDVLNSSSNRFFGIISDGAGEASFEVSGASDHNEFLRCAALNVISTGFYANALYTNFWNQGVFATMQATTSGAAMATGLLVKSLSGQLHISNSVLMANGPSDTIYQAIPNGIRADYNCYHRAFPATRFAEARVSTNPPSFGIRDMQFDHFNLWVDWNGGDSNSMEADPLFAGYENGDFHPMSAAGRFSITAGEFVTDSETSPLIDAAHPNLDWSVESAPNGNRANLGLYGGTIEASRSPADGSFLLKTLNEGGLVRGSFTLKWQARGGATNVGGVVLQLSTNGGTTWQTIVSGIAATNGQHVWDSTSVPLSLSARWRVQSQVNGSWVSTSARDFQIRNAPMVFYVNDDSVVGDTYCAAPGASGNTGLSPTSPMASLNEILDRYDLEPGDMVLIDAGQYMGSATPVIGYVDRGSLASPVVFQGSDSHPGTVFRGAGLAVTNTSGIEISHIKMHPLNMGFKVASVDFSENVKFEKFDVFRGGDGISISGSSNVWLRNFSVASVLTNGVSNLGSFNTRLEFGTIWSNGLVQILASAETRGADTGGGTNSFITVSNCIVGAYGLRRPIYDVKSSLFADRNNLYAANGALVALTYGQSLPTEYVSASRWAADSGQDGWSLSHLPRFANMREGDFHLMSTAGRFDPSMGGFVADAEETTSPLIDAGDPELACSEPAPNGGRVNMGRHGNTAEASKTPTNATLTLISFNDGGRAAGTNVVIRWLARGEATNGYVAISYSPDGGATWIQLVDGIPAADGSWTWNSTLVPQGVQGLLKIEGSLGGEALSGKYFSVRNQPFNFFVNDNSTEGDDYCTAVGNNANSGLTNSAPVADLNTLLSRYEMTGGDVIYIDTGIYRGVDPWRIRQANSAGTLGTTPVIFQGSTNSFPSRTVLDRQFSFDGILVDYAIGVRLRNLTISNTLGTAVALRNSYAIAADYISVVSGNIAFYLSAGDGLRIANSAVNDSNKGVQIDNSTSGRTNYPVIENNVFWGMNGTGIEIGNMTAYVRNNILSVRSNRYVYTLSSESVLSSDYNAVWLGDGGRMVFRGASMDSPVPAIYETVASWSALSGQDMHSYDGDPLMVAATNRDFHLKSQAGRWDPIAKIWTNDAVSSPLIDAGWPESPGWTNEPIPNGSRVNVGIFGGTPLASRSPTNSALHLLTLNRGGVASGQVVFNWKAVGMATGQTVRILVSTDNGENWISIVNGIPASLGSLIWNSLSQPSSARCFWRIESEQEPGISATSSRPFVLHNGPIRYYVNDSSTSGDVYCTGVGLSSNSGISADSPKRWISEILDQYDLEAGDVIYVDTGNYLVSAPTLIGDLDTGGISQDSAMQVTIQGSTNRMQGGTQFIVPDPSLNAFELNTTHGVRLRNLGIVGAASGISIQDSFFVAGDWLEIREGQIGIHAQASSNIVVRNCSLLGNRVAGIDFTGIRLGDLFVQSSVLWSNKYGITLWGGYANVSHSIIGMMSPNSLAYHENLDAAETKVISGNNSLFVGHPNASVAASLQSGKTTLYASVSRWMQTGRDWGSLANNPRLADPANRDFHLMSTRGRFDPIHGWVNDSGSSPLIDSGNTNSTAWTKEPMPNGRRMNIGLYGGTEEASKTPVEGWLTLVSLNDGGAASGLVELTWNANGSASNYMVCIEYSPDNGTSWTNIVCDWPANTGRFWWNSVPFGRSALSLWRIWCVEDYGINATSLRPFILRNGGTIPYYVNDTNHVGDVYCTQPGNDENDGLTPSTPKLTLQSILDSYELEPDDIVYVDSGIYPAGTPPILIDQMDSGWDNRYVTIQGSTNPMVRTVFSGTSLNAPCVFEFSYAKNIRMKNMTIQNANVGAILFESTGCEFVNVRIENNRSSALLLQKNSKAKALGSVFWNNNRLASSAAVKMGDSSIALENCVVWGHPTSFSGDGGISVTNSALDARGTHGRIYSFPVGGIANFSGDYNCYSRKDGALLAEQKRDVGGNDFYNDLPSWSEVANADGHSMTVQDPLFANELTGDFHPLSTKGRFVGSGWTNDMVQSPLIDAGNPRSVYTNEPQPNGGIINIGAYGNSCQASMTQTNPPWLRVISFNECQDVMTGDSLLYWLHGGMPSNAPVRLEYSTDYQISWEVLASNLTAGSRQYLWDISGMPLTVALNWRVVLESNTNIWDASDCPVAIKTANFDYYVNDSSTTGDVWCTGPGLEWDDNIFYGTNAATPLNSLGELLRQYPIRSGDRIFIDTGVYFVGENDPIVFDDRNMGTAWAPLKVYGSTNAVRGGALLIGDGLVDGISMRNTRHIELNDIRVSNASNGISIVNVDTVKMRGMELFQNSRDGVAAGASSGLEIKNSLFWKNGQYGFSSGGEKGGQYLINVTMWGNNAGAAYNGAGELCISNSILVMTNDAAIYLEGSSSRIIGDFNMFWMPDNGAIAFNAEKKIYYADMRQWQEDGRDLRSILGDPMFVNPANGNFHLQSKTGYWSNGIWAVSESTSWAIDAGEPGNGDYANEPAPNGGRLNLGVYGGMFRASKSDHSVPELLPLTLVDGGVAGGSQNLYWLYRGIDHAQTVRIEYSPDGGSSWVVIGSGIGVGSIPFAWFSIEDPTPEALWRIILESNTNIVGETTVPFIHRTRDLIYYVNDESQDGDVYTTAVGLPMNRGYRPDSPLHSVQGVMDRYRLLPGDEIRVDTGTFAIDGTISVLSLNAGVLGDPVTLVGSTNLVAGGTRFLPAPEFKGPAIECYMASYIRIKGFSFDGFSSGVSIIKAAGCELFDLDIHGSTGPGILLSDATRLRAERVLIRNGESIGIDASTSEFSMNGCVVWSNKGSAVSMGEGVVGDITNTVLWVSGTNNYCYDAPKKVKIFADYNNLFITNGAQIAYFEGLDYRRIPQWEKASSQDRNSISAEPLFHDPVNGDFHLRSVAGRYQLGTGWVNDAPLTNVPNYSPMIDMGAPMTPWANEPAPNGGKRNIGLYGNTWQASKSASSQWVKAITAMSGGLAYGGFTLAWGYGGGIDSNEMVRLEYSYDNGTENWVRIGEASVGDRGYYWRSDQLQAGMEIWMTSPAARWRLYLLSDTNVMDMTGMYFGLRNGPFRFYVNDDHQDGDVYTTAVGNDDNLGFYPAAPKRNLQTLLAMIDLEPTDRVYADTGIYHMSDTNWPIRWELVNSGGPGEPALFRGSTNALGSRFIATNRFGAGGFFFMEAQHVDMQDVIFEGESVDFSGQRLSVRNVSITGGALRVRGNHSTFQNVQIDQGSVSLSGATNRLERMRQRWGQTAIVGTNVVLLNSVIYSTNDLSVALNVDAAGAVVSNNTVVATRGTAMRKRGSGILRSSHNILRSDGDENCQVIEWQDGTLISDWNNLVARGGSWLGAWNGKWEKLAYWQTVSGQDANSVSFDPLFNDEEGGDFHLKSMAGRWDPGSSNWVVDATHSPVIDLGDIGAGAEPLPNGYRRNIGAYGGTEQGSKSLTNFWLRALTMNDGGVMKGGAVVLRWAVGNAGTKTVRVQYSADNGTTWSNIATGVSAASGFFTWNSVGFPDSFFARWRVVAEDGSGVMDQNDASFALRNQVQTFYVNDGSLTGDIYCSAAGNDANNGLTPGTPKRNIQSVFDAYDLEGGDTVLADTGTYGSSSNNRIIWSRSGTAALPVVIQGNSNGPLSVFVRTNGTGPSSIGFDVKASDIVVRHMAIQGVNRGFLLESNRNATIEGVVVEGANLGIIAQGTRGIQIRNSGLMETGVGIGLDNARTSVLENLTFALCTTAGIQMTNTQVDTIQNNVFIPAEGAFAFSVGAETSRLANAELDYNLYDFSQTNSGFLAGMSNDMRQWQLAFGKDYRSAITNADLADVEGGDFHPRSAFGRLENGSWVLDGTTSWAVDHGNPNQDYGAESAPNGGRRNIGMFGNTRQASRGDPADVSLTIRTLNGEVSEIKGSDPIWPLIWSAHQIPSNEWVLVQFSGDGGLTWTTLTNVPAYREYYVWQVGAQFQTEQARWRVIGVNDTNLVATSGQDIRIRFAELGFLSSPRPVSGLMRFEWEGGVQGKRYRIEYSDDFGKTWHQWEDKYNGPAPINRSRFTIAVGESQVSYTFEDRTSYLRRTRWYRLFELPGIE